MRWQKFTGKEAVNEKKQEKDLMKIRIFRYWPKDKAIPSGWTVVCTLGSTHHGKYSVLIEKIQEYAG